MKQIKKIGLLLLGFVLCVALGGDIYAARSQRAAKGKSVSKVDFQMSQERLNVLLANHAVLLIQTLKYHWDIVGREFHDYHLLFDKQYNQLFADMDLIAERVRAVGGMALGSMQQMLNAATLKEDTGDIIEPKQMIVRLLDQYEKLIAQIRDMIELLEAKTKDFGTKKMLEDLIEQHEKTAWMLRSLTGK